MKRKRDDDDKQAAVDVLYHLGLDTTMPLKEQFHDVKVVFMGGSADRMELLVNRVATVVGKPIPYGSKLVTVGKSERFSMFKVGPVITVSHGMGMPSLLILLHELTKLLKHAGATDYVYIRLGTSGGIGVDPGTVVVTTEAVNGAFEPVYRSYTLGEMRETPTAFNKPLIDTLMKLDSANVNIITGRTMSCDDFYEAQARRDGFFCNFTEDERVAYLRRAYDDGVRNIEMEAVVLASFCSRARIPAAVVCVTLLNRLLGDQVTATKQQLQGFTNKVISVALAYCRHRDLHLLGGHRGNE